MNLTAERARALFTYDSETGLLRWSVSPSNNVRVGDVAGRPDRKGYLCLQADGRFYKAHRIVWLIVTGDWPTHHIDHIDHDTANNRSENLRDVTRSVNAQNQRGPQPRSTNRFLGISWNKHACKWMAQIGIDGRNRYLGLHTTPEAAYAAYLTAKRKYHAGCTI